MSTTLTTSVKASINWNYQSAVSGIANTSNVSSFTYSKSFADGTGPDQADLLYLTVGTLAPSASISLDLDGVLEDLFGNTLSMARIKAVYIQNSNDEGSTKLIVGGDPNALVNWVGNASDVVNVRNNGVLFLSAPDAIGYVVTPGTGDVLLLTNGDGSNSALYKVAVLGASL